MHALSSEGDPDFYAEDEIERCSEEFHLKERDLETDFSKDAKSCQPTCDEQLRNFQDKDYKNHLIEHFLQKQPKKVGQYVK